MKKIRFTLLLVPFMLLGCNNSNVNSPKSPFNDSYNPTGMTGKYSITSAMSSEDYDHLKEYINSDDFKDNEDSSLVSSYSKTEETRDLKAAYFGKNLGAANLCSLTHQVNNNTRYKNNVTTKFNTAHKENQNVSGGINKVDSYVNDYFNSNDATYYDEIEQSWIQNETVKTKKVVDSVLIPDPSPFILTPYTTDIKTYFGEKSRGKSKITFNVLSNDNKAIYGMSGEKYLIKEAASLFEPYSTTVGDTYKAVNNYFYEALLEKVPNTENKFRFTDFRYYTELLILSEAISDETTVPVVYLEKPQLVEYSEITYSITYKTDITEEFDKGKIPVPDPSI